MNESIIFFCQNYTFYETQAITTILISYLMRLASNKVVHGKIGRCLKDCTFNMVFTQKHIRGVRLRKQSGSKLVRQTDR